MYQSTKWSDLGFVYTLIQEKLSQTSSKTPVQVQFEEEEEEKQEIDAHEQEDKKQPTDIDLQKVYFSNI